MQVADSSPEEVTLKTKRPRITLEPYDERKVEVIHDDGQEIYEPVPTLSEKFLQVVHKVREQQQQEQQAQQKAEATTDAPTTSVINSERPLSHYLHMARIEVEFMGHTLDMIRDGLFMLPHATKAQNLATIQVNELAIPLEGKKAALVRAAERIRKAANGMKETIDKDHEGYLPSLLALRSRWRFHSTATPTPYGMSLKIAVDYGHSTVGGPSPLQGADPPEAYVTRAKDDGSLELTFKKAPDADLHFVLSVPQKRGEAEGGDSGGAESGGEGGVKEIVVSARSLSAVGAEDEGERGGTKFMKSVKKLIRAHECQFNEEMFQKIVSETDQKEDKRIVRSRFIEDAIHIDSGHFGSGSCLTIRKGVQGNYSHNNPPERHLPQVLLLAARCLYLAQCLHSAQQMQTLSRNSQPTTPLSMSVLGGICDIFLHIDMRGDVISTLEKMAETYPIAVHWTSHGPSKSSCVVRNSHNYNYFSQTPTATFIKNSNSNNNNNYATTIKPNTTVTVDGVVVVYLDGREITCTISSSTLRVVHPRELVQFIKNYFRFL